GICVPAGRHHPVALLHHPVHHRPADPPASAGHHTKSIHRPQPSGLAPAGTRVCASTRWYLGGMDTAPSLDEVRAELAAIHEELLTLPTDDYSRRVELQ